ncbi:hypothetical protein SASPL_127639 [Salvia splendens]|uniref:Uncharacterized protein n=1 Tax=Salvia splendens TaxID=180675 RepID=A0A8X8XBK2_SALSN|nr:hypothetical protein SASPL_127639 [Salvia splendens]
MENLSAISRNPCLNSSPLRPKTTTVLPFSPAELPIRKNSRRDFSVKAALNANTVTSPIAKENGDVVVIAEPIYERTPRNRPLRTRSQRTVVEEQRVGMFHFDGTARKFFEGWYFKVSIPECRQSFCFMYSLENPAFSKKLSRLEEAQYGPRSTGIGAQILGADDKFICQFSEESKNFWGDRDELMLGSTFVPQKNMKPPKREIPPQEFNSRVLEGFQVTPLWHQGSIRDDGRLHAGPTAHALFMDGEMLGQNRSKQQDGLLLFLYLNLTGKYVWQADFQQLLWNSWGLKHIIILQLETDLVQSDDARKQYAEIQRFTKGTIAGGAPIIPLHANMKDNIKFVLEHIVNNIPIPKRDFLSPPLMKVIGSFDLNKVWSEIDEIKGYFWLVALKKRYISVVQIVNNTPVEDYQFLRL